MRGIVVVLLAFAISLPVRAADPVRVVPAAGVGVESAALLMSGQQGGEIPFQALALPIRGEDGKARVLVRFRMDGPALLEGQTRDVLRIETSLYALGTGGGVQGSVLETIEIDLAPQRDSVQRGGVDLLASLDLKPGAYSLRLLARNLDTGRLGVRTLPLPVPELAALDEAPPLSPPPAGGDPRPTARSASLGPLDPPPFPDDPLSRSQAASSAWAAPLPVIPDTAEGRKLRGEIHSAYRDALARLAAGREADALAAVAAFEDGILLRKGKPVPGLADQIIEVETETARELALKDAATLAPLLRLHQRLYEEAAVKGRLQGSSVAREVARRLTDLCRELGRTEVAHRFATVFGIELLRRGVSVQGAQMLQSVLAEDPGNEAALLELASSAERRGAHGEAIPYLQALLRAHPDHRDARFRLTLDQALLGQAAEAEKGLRTVLQEETGGWRLALAYQELARMQLAQQLPGAVRTLREGLQRCPGDEKLTFLLAALLDRTGQQREARQLLAGFKPEEDEGGGAARRRYSGPSEEPLATLNADFGREAAEKLPALAGALERTAP